MKTRIDGIEVETDGNYRIGFVMSTATTRKWTKEQLEEGNAREEKMIFVDFEPSDQGKGKRLICECKTAGQAINTMIAIRTARLDARFELADIIHKLLETSEYAKFSNESLQAAINAMVEGGGYSSEFSDMQDVLDARKELEEIADDWRTQ